MADTPHTGLTEIEAFVRDVAMSLPPSDFGSWRAIKAMSAAIKERERTTREAADFLFHALQDVIDWADFAMKNPQEFDSHGVRNLDGPAFAKARTAIALAKGGMG